MTKESTDDEPKALESTKPKEVVFRNRLNIKLSFVASMCLLIFVAGILVVVAYYVYWQDTDRKYDIARPGNAASEQDLKVEDAVISDATARVDAPATKQKIEFMTKEINALDAINKFDPSDLSDQNIHLVPSDQPSL